MKTNLFFFNKVELPRNFDFIIHLGIKSKVYFQQFVSSENAEISTPIVKHKGLKACDKLSEKTFRSIFEDDKIHGTTQAELNVQQYRVFAAKVYFFL